MKRLMSSVVLLILAEALVAFGQTSSRVDWIPTSAAEIEAYHKAEINSVTVGLYATNSSGAYLVDVFALNRVFRTSDWGSVGVATSNKIYKYLTRYLRDNDPATQTFFVGVLWESCYDTNGINCTYSTVGFSSKVWGSQLFSQSPTFTFPRVGGVAQIPPQAFELSCDWLDGYTSMAGKDVKRVDYSGPYRSSVTANGGTPGCFPGSADNGRIYISSQTVSIYEWDSRTNFPSTITVWYNSDRTDGTEWRWDSTGVHKREIPSLIITPQSGGGGLRIVLKGSPGRVYSLEDVAPSLPAPEKKVLGTVTADTNGNAVWLVQPTGDLQIFRARLRP